MDGRIPVDLTGVPETLLWTLYFRAQEAARPDTLLADPLAVDLVSRLEYPFETRLGRGENRAQWQALRAATFDLQVRRFLADRPGGTVIALGEGLETAFWRVDDGLVRWVGVDLPETATLRRAVLPVHDRHSQVAVSVLDDAWTREVDTSRGVLVTAQGLLMYLGRDQVHDVVRRCVDAFAGAPGGATLLFDGVPAWTSRVTSAATARGAGGQGGPDGALGALVPPAMPWPVSRAEIRALRRLPGVHDLTRLHPPRGRGPAFGALLPLVDRVPLLQDLVLSVWRARLG